MFLRLCYVIVALALRVFNACLIITKIRWDCKLVSKVPAHNASLSKFCSNLFSKNARASGRPPNPNMHFTIEMQNVPWNIRWECWSHHVRTLLLADARRFAIYTSWKCNGKLIAGDDAKQCLQIVIKTRICGIDAKHVQEFVVERNCLAIVQNNFKRKMSAGSSLCRAFENLL